MKKATRVLKRIIAEQGIEILQEEQRLKAILADLLPDEKRIRYLLELSIRADIPKILSRFSNEPYHVGVMHINTLKSNFKSDYFIENDVVEKLFKCWIEVIPKNIHQELIKNEDSEMDDDSFQIVEIKGEFASIGIHPYWESGLFSFRNSNGRSISQYKYSSVKKFTEGLALVGMNGKYGFIDKNGVEVIPLIFDCAESFSEGLALVGLEDKLGYINKAGVEVIPLIYDNAQSFSDGFAAVKSRHRAFYIDNTNKHLRLQGGVYKELSSFKDGFAWGQSGVTEKWSLLNINGEIILKDYYDRAGGNFTEGLASVPSDYYAAYIDKEGNEALCFNPNPSRLFFNAYGLKEDGFAKEEKSKQLPEFPIRRITNVSPSPFNNGKSIVRFMGSTGQFCPFTTVAVLINNRGKMITQCWYSNIDSFHDGLAVVSTWGLYGYIDTSGTEVIPAEYSEAFPFSEGLALVTHKYQHERYFIDNQSNKVFQLHYNIEGDGPYFSEGLLSVEKDGKYGFIDTAGNLVIPFKFDHAHSFKNGFANVRLGDKWGSIDKGGNWIEDFD